MTQFGTVDDQRVRAKLVGPIASGSRVWTNWQRSVCRYRQRCAKESGPDRGQLYNVLDHVLCAKTEHSLHPLASSCDPAIHGS